MKTTHILVGVVIILLAVTCSYFTVPTIEYTKVWWWDLPTIALTKPYSFLALPLYGLGIIVMVYGIIKKEE